MKKILLLWMILVGLLHNSAWSQAPSSPYQTDWLRDGAIVAGGIGASFLGSALIDKKDRLTEADLASLRVQDVSWFDRFAAGNYSTKAESTSDFFFYGSFVTPLFLLFDDAIQQSAPQVFLLYGQTLAIAGGLYSLSAGFTQRKRPYIYAADVPLGIRTDKQATNSFYGGHTAATAAATFFLAKVYHDFNPDSPARPYIWIAAAALPAAVGYMRLRAGKHFLSDNLVGYAVGTGVGILVPELHRITAKKNLGLIPVSGPGYNGILFSYTF